MVMTIFTELCNSSGKQEYTCGGGGGGGYTCSPVAIVQYTYFLSQMIMNVFLNIVDDFVVPEIPQAVKRFPWFHEI